MPGAKIYLWAAKYRFLIYLLLGFPLALGAGYALCAHFLALRFYIPGSKFQLIFIPLAELFCLFLFLDIYLHNQKSPRSLLAWQLAFCFTALNLALVVLLANYYSAPARLQYPSVQLSLRITPFVAALLLGGALLAFWMGFRKLIRDAWLTFRFEDDFYRVRPAAWLTIMILLVGLIVGTGLRLYHLDGFPPYVDEYIHTHAASLLLHGAPLALDRAFLPVTLPVYLSYRLFGISLWASRLPMVLLNMLAIFPLYALGKKINRTVGYLCVALFVFSPWLLAVSRTVREYAVAPLLFYLAAALLTDLLDWDGLSLRQYVFKHKYRLVVLVMILGYAIYDNYSTLRTIIAVYGIWGMIAVLKFLKHGYSLRLKIGVLCAGFALAGVLVLWMGVISRFFKTGSFIYNIASLYWASLVHNEVRQWYSIGGLGYVIVVASCILSIRAIFRKYHKSDFVVLFCYLVFAAYLAYLTFFIARPRVPIRVRYGALMEYWYLIIVAIFLYIFFRLLGWVFNQKMIPIVITCVLVMAGLFTNYRALEYALAYRGGGASLITGEKHYLLEPGYEFLAARLTNQDVLLTDVLDSYDEISKQVLHPLKMLSYYNLVLSEDMEAVTVIAQYPQGWIAVAENSMPWEFGLEAKDFIYNGTKVKFKGIHGEVYLWQWGEAMP